MKKGKRSHKLWLFLVNRNKLKNSGDPTILDWIDYLLEDEIQDDKVIFDYNNDKWILYGLTSDIETAYNFMITRNMEYFKTIVKDIPKEDEDFDEFKEPDLYYYRLRLARCQTRSFCKKDPTILIDLALTAYESAFVENAYESVGDALYTDFAVRGEAFDHLYQCFTKSMQKAIDKLGFPSISKFFSTTEPVPVLIDELWDLMVNAGVLFKCYDLYTTKYMYTHWI